MKPSPAAPVYPAFPFWPVEAGDWVAAIGGDVCAFDVGEVVAVDTTPEAIARHNLAADAGAAVTVRWHVGNCTIVCGVAALDDCEPFLTEADAVAAYKTALRNRG